MACISMTSSIGLRICFSPQVRMFPRISMGISVQDWVPKPLLYFSMDRPMVVSH
jgi:hypothetical protein